MFEKFIKLEKFTLVDPSKLNQSWFKKESNQKQFIQKFYTWVGLGRKKVWTL